MITLASLRQAAREIRTVATQLQLVDDLLEQSAPPTSLKRGADLADWRAASAQQQLLVAQARDLLPKHLERIAERLEQLGAATSPAELERQLEGAHAMIAAAGRAFGHGS